MNETEDILDLPPSPDHNPFWKRFVLFMRRLSVLLVLIALVIYVQHYPYANEIWGLASVVWFAWNGVYIFLLLKGFFGPEGIFSEVSYSLGRILLLAAVLTVPMGGTHLWAKVFFVAAASTFLFGVISAKRWF